MQLPLQTTVTLGPSAAFHPVTVDFRLAPHPSASLPPDMPPNEPSQPPTPPPQTGIPFPTRYFNPNELDQRAEPLNIEPLIFPEAAYIRGISGVVKVRVYINEAGSIDAVDILSATPPDLFEQAALDALLKTRFSPAKILGMPVKSIKVIEISFDRFADRPLPETK